MLTVSVIPYELQRHLQTHIPPKQISPNTLGVEARQEMNMKYKKCIRKKGSNSLLIIDMSC